MREVRHLSLRALARACGLSVNTIGLIERGKTSPSVSTLQALATALNVPITTFFEDHQPSVSVLFTPAYRRPQIALPDGVLEQLGQGLPEQCFQPLILRLEVGGGSGPDPILHAGHEFVLCLSGCLSYEVGGAEYVMAQGDSLLFESHLPHRWRNAGAEVAEALLVLYAPGGASRTVDLHLG
jgi:transcriptional regulator with XRE-family HTH domain